jgi:anti-sigma B factor antagonist
MEAAQEGSWSDPGRAAEWEVRDRLGPRPPFVAGVHLNAGDDVCHGTVTLAGELDLATKSTADEAIRRAEQLADVVILDLRGLSFMGSAGLHLVLDANDRHRQAGRRLVVVTGPPQVERILLLPGVAEQLEITDDLTSAHLPPVEVGDRR